MPDIVIAAPFTSGDVQRLRNVEAGAVFVVDGATLPAFGSVIDGIVNASAAQAWGQNRHDRMGAALAVGKIDPEASDGLSGVLVGAPTSSSNGTEMAGRVLALHF